MFDTPETTLLTGGSRLSSEEHENLASSGPPEFTAARQGRTRDHRCPQPSGQQRAFYPHGRPYKEQQA